MTGHKRNRKGKGIVEAFNWVKDKVSGLNNHLKQKRYIGRLVDNPLINGAIAWVAPEAVPALHAIAS